jgi:hypothetical protein
MFCAGCGAPVRGAFCGFCGQPAAPAAAPQAQPGSAPAAPAAASKGSSLGKILLIVFGCFVLLGALAVGGIYYAVGRVKAKSLQAISQAVGRNPCALISKEEVQEVLGVPIEKTAGITDGGEPGCAFFASPEAFQQLARDSLAKVPGEAQAGAAAEDKAGRKSDNPLSLLNNESIKNLEGIVKTFAIAGQAQQGDGRVFGFTLESNFGLDWSTFRATLGVIPGFESLSGVGDNAMIGPFGHVLYVQKGRAKVTLNLMAVPDARNKGVALARKIVSRL